MEDIGKSARVKSCQRKYLLPFVAERHLLYSLSNGIQYFLHVVCELSVTLTILVGESAERKAHTIVTLDVRDAL